MTVKKPRGTKDWFNKEWITLYNIILKFSNFALENNFCPIETPIFESQELFDKGLTEDSSDNTERYNFFDKKNRKLSLRPENTVPVLRAIDENNLLNTLKTKEFFYFGSYFRYERPQKGRKRQFKQWGVESYVEKSSFYDAKLIFFAYKLLNSLKLKNFILKLNFLGNIKTISSYVKSKLFQDKYLENIENWCKECKKKFEEKDNNIKKLLLLLDCKNCKKYTTDFPKIQDFFTLEQKNYFFQLKEYLTSWGVAFEVDNYLVRGLNYYTDIVFEFVSTVFEMTKSSLLGGGRYDNLSKTIVGKENNAIGFAIGLERLLLALDYENLEVDNLFKEKKKKVVLLLLDENLNNIKAVIKNLIENKNITLEVVEQKTKKLNSILKKVYSNLDNDFLIVFGKSENTNKKVVIKSLKDKKNQELLAIDKLNNWSFKN